MTPPIDLEALKKLEAEATKGPWCEHPNGTSVWSGEHYDAEGSQHIANMMQTRKGLHLVDEQVVINCAFIAAARNALPALIAELEEKRKEVERLEEIVSRIPVRLRE
jgi:hypothetical protein